MPSNDQLPGADTPVRVCLKPQSGEPIRGSVLDASRELLSRVQNRLVPWLREEIPYAIYLAVCGMGTSPRMFATEGEPAATVQIRRDAVDFLRTLMEQSQLGTMEIVERNGR